MENTKSSWRRLRLYWQTLTERKKKNSVQKASTTHCKDLISQRPLKKEKKKKKEKLNCSPKLLMAEIWRLLQQQLNKNRIVRVLQLSSCLCYVLPTAQHVISTFSRRSSNFSLVRDGQNISTKHPPIYSDNSPSFGQTSVVGRGRAN